MKKTISVILSAMLLLSAFSLLAYADGEVEGIKIYQNALSLGIGESYTLSAEVYGTTDDKSVNWSITGNKSAETTIASTALCR